MSMKKPNAGKVFTALFTTGCLTALIAPALQNEIHPLAGYIPSLLLGASVVVFAWAHRRA